PGVLAASAGFLRNYQWLKSGVSGCWFSFAPAIRHAVMQPQRGVISVAELARRLRRVTEVASISDWVDGEVRGVRRVASGHSYFTLRDAREDALIDCVMYRSALLRAGRHLSEGAR